MALNGVHPSAKAQQSPLIQSTPIQNEKALGGDTDTARWL